MGCSYSAADSIPSRVDVEQCVPVDSVEQGTPEAAQVEVGFVLCENGVGMRWDFWFEHVFHQSHLSMKEMGRLRANRCEFIQFHLEKVNVDRVWRLNVACLAWLVVSRLQHAGSKRTSWYTQSDLPA